MQRRDIGQAASNTCSVYAVVALLEQYQSFLRNIVQVSFYRACENLAAQVLEEEAETMMDGTEHWLRHIGISEDVQIRLGGTRQR